MTTLIKGGKDVVSRGILGPGLWCWACADGWYPPRAGLNLGGWQWLRFQSPSAPHTVFFPSGYKTSLLSVTEKSCCPWCAGKLGSWESFSSINGRLSSFPKGHELGRVVYNGLLGARLWTGSRTSHLLCPLHPQTPLPARCSSESMIRVLFIRLELPSKYKSLWKSWECVLLFFLPFFLLLLPLLFFPLLFLFLSSLSETCHNNSPAHCTRP